MYEATETVEDELLLCPDKLNNINQIKQITDNSNSIFICLTHSPSFSPKSKPIDNFKRRQLADKDYSPPKKIKKLIKERNRVIGMMQQDCNENSDSLSATLVADDILISTQSDTNYVNDQVSSLTVAVDITTTV